METLKNVEGLVFVMDLLSVGEKCLSCLNNFDHIENLTIN